jgi:hypothetical protein
VGAGQGRGRHLTAVPGPDPGQRDDRRQHPDCTLADGSALTERILAVDDEHHRVAYAITAASPQPAYHHASMQVFPEGRGCRLVWITDIEPGDAAAAMGQDLDTALADLAETARRLPAAG